jgi:hypothetical protein
MVEHRPRLLVAGVVRNGAKTMSGTVEQIRKLFQEFADLEFFIVESDSSDSTVAELCRLSNVETSFSFQSLGDLRFVIPDRVLRISFARNIYLDHLELVQSATENPPSHLVVADFDGVNSNIQSFASPSQLLREETVVCANQLGRYYDILALRCPGWITEDYRVLIEEFVGSGNSAAVGYLENLLRAQKKIPKFSREIDVDSAFGGLAIYPVSLIKNARYFSENLPNKKIVPCEHVSFSNQIRSLGGVIKILPSLRNGGDWRHTWFSSDWIVNFLTVMLKNSTLRKFFDFLLLKKLPNLL